MPVTLAESLDLSGRIALVTGASSGLGKHFSQVLASQGAVVVAAARRRDKTAQTVELIRKAGGSAHGMDLDVTDAESVERCFAQTIETVGVPQIVVNNAGVSRTAYLADLTEEDWDAVVDTNLKGVFLVAQQAARAMIGAEKTGSIINIASILGYRVSKMLGPYVAAKSGVVNLTKSMALEWARNGIRVNAIAPGYFQTEMNEGFFETEAARAMLKMVPMKRTGELQELTIPLLLLASDAGSYMTGSSLIVDGGHVCSSL